MPEPKRQMLFQVVRPDGEVETFRIGPHTPAMRTEDVHLVHRIWLDATRYKGLEGVHHSDLVSMALTRFARDYTGTDRENIIRELHKLEDKRGHAPGVTVPANPTKEKKPPEEPPLLHP
jgi:hypothetical protein